MSRGVLATSLFSASLLIGLSGTVRAEGGGTLISHTATQAPSDWNWSPDLSGIEASVESATVAVQPESEPYFLSGAAPTVATIGGAETRISRTSHRDGSASLSAANAWRDTEVGVDVSLAAARAAGPLPSAATGSQDANGASAWARTALPGVSRVSPFEQATVDVRVDPVQDQGRVGTTLSREWVVNDAVTARVNDSYGLVGGTSGGQWETGKSLSVDVRPTNTTLSVGASTHSGDTTWLPSVSASQKLMGPLTVTTSVAETGDGLNKSVTAGFRSTW